MAYNPSPYKISTITATARLNTCLNLDALFENIEIATGEHGVVFAEYGSKDVATVFKGYSKKMSVTHRKSEKKKRFDNQITMIYQYNDENATRFRVNCKLFKNGHVQMTGLKHTEQGRDVISIMVKQIREMHKSARNIVTIEDEDAISCIEYLIRLINCDFRVGFEVRRDQLHKVIGRQYHVISSFEPCIYPGCKIQYWFNMRNLQQDGKCRCMSKCNGKGVGIGDGNCKKITISVFQSGCIIITGGQNKEQIEEAYGFICDCMKTHFNDIKKIALPIS